MEKLHFFDFKLWFEKSNIKRIIFADEDQLGYEDNFHVYSYNFMFDSVYFSFNPNILVLRATTPIRETHRFPKNTFAIKFINHVIIEEESSFGTVVRIVSKCEDTEHTFRLIFQKYKAG